MTRRLIVMVKAPLPGRVKTRLSRDIGAIPATWWYRHQVARTLRRLEDPRWQLLLAVAPDRAVAGRWWPVHLPRIAQGGGTLGDRMRRRLQMAPGPTVLIGSDIPGIQPRHIWRAFQALGRTGVVFGPAEDGGYWLVGRQGPRALPPGAMRDVRWGTGHAMADTVRSLGGMRYSLADRLRDVDRGADLEGGPGHTFRMTAAGPRDTLQP